MALDTPRTTDSADLPSRAGHKRSHSVLIAVASAARARGFKHREGDLILGVPEVRIWDPDHSGPTLVARHDVTADPDRGADGLTLLVRLDYGDEPAGVEPRFSRLEDDDAERAADQIEILLRAEEQE